MIIDYTRDCFTTYFWTTEELEAFFALFGEHMTEEELEVFTIATFAEEAFGEEQFAVMDIEDPEAYFFM